MLLIMDQASSDKIIDASVVVNWKKRDVVAGLVTMPIVNVNSK